MTPPQSIADKLSEAERRVMPHMSNGEDIVLPIAQVAEEAGLSVTEARAAFRSLRLIQLAVYGTLYNEDDGKPRGSGTWLTPLGLSVRNLLQEQVKP